MLIQEIGFGVYIGKCENCGDESEIYMLSDFSYGEKLLLTEDGQDFAYLNCFEDNVFNETGEIVKMLCKGKGYSDSRIAELSNVIFELTCDPIFEKRIDVRRIQRTCKKCKSGHVMIGQGPNKTCKVSVPIVTHLTWEQKSAEEQMIIIRSYLRDMGCI